MRHRLIQLAMRAVLAATIAGLATPASAASEADCFDAEVTATIVRQTPTDFPECDDCIIMRWPWFVELHVERIHQGRAAKGPLTVLTVQHAHYRPDLGARRWLLRRNTLGSFNVVQSDTGERPQRCSPGSPPARPYIVPADGETLDDLRRELERRNQGDPVE